jgi:hypothetical protein
MQTAKRFIAFAALAMQMLFAAAASADDFHMRADLEHVGKRAVDIPEKGVKKMFQGLMVGDVSSKTTPRLAGATDVKSWAAVVPAAGKPTVVGHETIRAPDGSQLYVRFVGIPSSAAEDGKGRGTWSILGGTGAFKGATGAGEYVYISNDAGGIKTFTGELEHGSEKASAD